MKICRQERAGRSICACAQPVEQQLARFSTCIRLHLGNNKRGNDMYRVSYNDPTACLRQLHVSNYDGTACSPRHFASFTSGITSLKIHAIPTGLVVLALIAAFDMHGVLGWQSSAHCRRSLISIAGQAIRHSQSHACACSLESAPHFQQAICVYVGSWR